ncbi:MAG: UvrD-helicase domain-containing protein [Treponema sp.]|nr:UvrD-helicase domain-containing protein [Treponema sp.]
MSVNKIKQDLNTEQKKAAFCKSNAVVAAGAGSGKTKVLASRFVWLITEKGYKADEILTLTFTKRAAAEMFSRIYSLVLETAGTETGIASKRAQQALEDFIHARIQTLDSYCASIVRQCAPRYGISPDFQIDQEFCKNLALEISYPFFIAHRDHPAIKKLYGINSPDNIASGIFAQILFNYCHIDKPVDFLSDCKNQFDIICTEWEKLSDKIEEIITDLQRGINEDNALLPVLVPVMDEYSKEKTEIPKRKSLQEYFDLLKNTPLESSISFAESHPLQKTILKFIYFLDSISSLSLRGGKRAARDSQGSGNSVKENILKLRDLMDSVSSLAISCLQSGLILSVMSLLSELQDIYLTKKRANSVLTYKDVARLSRTILIEQKDIRQSEKETFKAIMIDEFQDNNELQKDILFLLAEKLDISNSGIPSADDLKDDKLFFVGDEKQSIYFFRGADVSVFRKLKDEIKSADLPLKINYRSSPHLIGAFNTIFGGSVFDPSGESPLGVFPSVFAPEQSLPPYEAGYSPLKSFKDDSGKLSLCILNSHNNSENEQLIAPDENEARFVAEKIKQLLSEKKEDGKQKYQPHDIAILFRTGTSQYHFEKHLRFLNIPYTCENIGNLFFGGLVNDIISVLRLASHPADKASYAEMLRSPFAGLSLAGTAYCISLDVPFDDKPLEHLEKADREKYLNGQRLYESICKKSSKESISSLLSELWHNEGYRYETEWNSQTSVYRDMFDYLFHHAAIADSKNQTLASFTDAVIAARDKRRNLEEIDIPLERSGAVRLTTIHKSKGLEYPVVFLCCCGRKSQTDRCDVAYHSPAAGIVFSPPPPAKHEIFKKRSNFFWEQANEDTKRKRIAELRRLLYVGMTRAENELYITGSLNIKNEENIDDFSILLKKYINTQCEKSRNYIDGDYIWNNDTLFGLLLPSIVCHISEDGSEKSDKFFLLEEIPRYTEEYAQNQELNSANLKNNQNGLNEFFAKTETFYRNAKIIKTPLICNNHITPVSLRVITETTDMNFVIDSGLSGSASYDIFEKVDSILLRFSQNGDEHSRTFNSGSFGTIAHICVEALLNNEEVIIPSDISGVLPPLELSAIIEAGKDLAGRFVNSPLGKKARNADFRESEFSFRSIIKNSEGSDIFINGAVDLFFEDDSSMHIVDFKTDSNEKPDEHIAQLSCYYRAISELFAKKGCRVWLYYLRTGHAVEMTEKVKQFNLEQIAFSMI